MVSGDLTVAEPAVLDFEDFVLEIKRSKQEIKKPTRFIVYLEIDSCEKTRTRC